MSGASCADDQRFEPWETFAIVALVTLAAVMCSVVTDESVVIFGAGIAGGVAVTAIVGFARRWPDSFPPQMRLRWALPICVAVTVGIYLLADALGRHEDASGAMAIVIALHLGWALPVTAWPRRPRGGTG